MPALARDGAVYVLTLGADGSRFTPELIAELETLVDEVESAPAPRALVTTAHGKSWALGLDLGWIAANRDTVNELVTAMHELMARLLGLSVPTVAAIGGHAIAGGGLLALTHDFRVMRADRGFFCLPEIDGQIPFTPGLTALVPSRLRPQVAHEALLTGRRYSGVEALAAGIVDRVAGEAEVLPSAVAVAAELAGKHPATLATVKAELYRNALEALRRHSVRTVDSSGFDAAISLLA